MITPQVLLIWGLVTQWLAMAATEEERMGFFVVLSALIRQQFRPQDWTAYEYGCANTWLYMQPEPTEADCAAFRGAMQCLPTALHEALRASLKILTGATSQDES